MLRCGEKRIATQVLKWTPNGQRGIRRPKNTWKRDLEKKVEATGAIG